MKKFYSIFIILIIVGVLGILPSAAQEARVTVTYTENFNDFSYTGQEDDGTSIYAIGGGTARCNVTVESVPRGAQLDSIYVRMSGVNDPVKLTAATGTATFNIANVTAMSTYSFTATVFYTTRDEEEGTAVAGSGEFRGDKRINVYPLPAMPQAQAGASAVYERGATASITHSLTTATGGNTTGWQYNWTITTRDNGVSKTETRSGSTLDYAINTSFSSDVKTLREISFEAEVFNQNPVKNTEAWVKMSYSGFGTVKVYNVPAHQPAKLGHFTDKESNQNFYVVMDMGVTDNQITNGGYVFNFISNDGQKTEKTRKVDFTEGQSPYTNVYAQWSYDDGYRVPVQAPAQVEVVELSLDYKYTNVKIEPNSEYKDDARLLKTAVTTEDMIHYFAKSHITLEHEVKGVGFDIESGTGRVTTHLGELLAWSAELTDSHTWMTVQPNVYDYYLEVKGKLRVESAINVTVDITGQYTSPTKIHIWDLPEEAKVEPYSKSCTDIEYSTISYSPILPQGGYPNGWHYKWVRKNIAENLTDTVSRQSSCWDNNLLNDDSTVKSVRRFEYILYYHNLAPDNATVWFSDSIKAGEKIVYNAPEAPQSLLYITSGDSTIFAASNIGLSDEQLKERDYKFYFDTTSGEPRILDTRFYEGPFEPWRVACLWIYDIEGTDDTFKAKSRYADKVEATLGEEFVVETSTKDKDGQEITGYLGSVSEGEDVYVLTGTPNRLKVKVSDNYKVEKASIAINEEDYREAQLEGTSAYLAFCPEDEEVAEYMFKAKIDYAPILDFYTENGETKYVYLGEDDPISTEVGTQTKLHVYPRPVVPDAKLDSVYLTDWELKNIPYTIQAATGANASGWKYSWETGDAENITEDLKCTVKLNSVGGIDGPANKIKNVKVRAKYENESPVAGQNWFETYVNIADINIYNRPNKVGELVKYKDEANEYYIAKGLNCGDDNLKRFEYKFRFLNGDNVVYEGDSRTVRADALESAPDKVCTVVTYPKDDNHNEFVVATDPVAFNGTEVTPVFHPGMSHVEDTPTEKYRFYNTYNFRYRHDDNLGYYDLVETQYRESLYTEGEFSLLSGKLDDMFNAQGSTLSYTRAYEQKGEFLPKVSGELQYAAEPNIPVEEGKYTKLHFDYTFPKECTVHIYPEPVVPDDFSLDNVQFRDIDPIVPMEVSVPFNPSGANEDGWDFYWAFDGENLGHGMQVPAQRISSIGMEKVDHEYIYRWTNASPMPNDPDPYWMSHQQRDTISVYNTPEAPSAFVRKGNGTSGIYIANGLSLNDDQLSEYKYQFQFGDNEPVESNAILTEQVGRRWYTYSSARSPWVRSVWVYNDGHLCYSDYVIAESSRAEFTVEDIFNYEGDDMRVYTTTGAALGNVSLRNLSTGLYIVEIGTGDDRFIKKVYVK